MMQLSRQQVLQAALNDTTSALALVDAYIQSRLQLCQEFEVALLKEDFNLMSKKAHALKGAIGIWGDDALTEVIREIERLCKANDLKGTKAHFATAAVNLQNLDLQLLTIKAELNGVT